MKINFRTLFSVAKKYAFTIALIATVAIGAAAQTNTFPSDGNAGVGTTAPTQKLQVNGVGLFTGGSVSGNTAAGVYIFDQNIASLNGSNARDLNIQAQSLRFFTGTTYAEKMRIDANGNLGIGTTSPNQRLSVVGTGAFYNSTPVTPSGVRGLFMGNYSVGSSIWSYDYGSGQGDPLFITAQDINLSTYVGGNGINRLHISNGGNIGIGTVNPAFDVNVTKYLALDGGSYFGSIGVGGSITSTPHPVGQYAFFNSGLGGSEKRIATIVGATDVATNSGKIDFWTTSAGSFGIGPKMSIFSNGNVGINTNNPGYKLDVNGEINATGLRINGTPISGGGNSQWTGTSSIYYNGGNVGIGTTNPDKKLVVIDGASLYLKFLRSSNDGLYMYADGNYYGLNAYDFTNQAYKPMSIGWGQQNLYLARDGGNVGIGTTNPAYKLDVSGEIRSSTGGFRFPDGSVQTTAGTSSQWANGSGNINYTSGNVGIGTTTPGTYYGVQTKVEISSTTYGVLNLNSGSGYSGGLSLSRGGASDWIISNRADGSAGRLAFFNAAGTEQVKFLQNGNVEVAGTINAKYQDLAEWVPSAEQLSAGTVVVLDTTKSNQVISSGEPYDTRVAGVISAQPGITLGESGEGKVLVATTGRVRVKVDASRKPIKIGDLLVTSDVPGVAMKSEPVEFAGRKMHMPGTIIGKALEPLAKGSGEILVLLSLQ